MSAAAQFDMAALLEMAEAKPPRYGRGKWGCPDCGRPGHVSVDFNKEAFKCWHAGCQFRGYRATLEKRLGLSRKLTPAEQRERRQVLHESKHAADWLAGTLRVYRLRFTALHRRLLTVQARATERLRATPQDEAAWSRLVLTYRVLPKVRAALAILEDGPTRQRLAFLLASRRARKEMLCQIVERGGLPDAKAHFVDIEICCSGAVAV